MIAISLLLTWIVAAILIWLWAAAADFVNSRKWRGIRRPKHGTDRVTYNGMHMTTDDLRKLRAHLESIVTLTRMVDRELGNVLEENNAGKHEHIAEALDTLDDVQRDLTKAVQYLRTERRSITEGWS